MVYNSFYGLVFNPFAKQQPKEREYFRSKDFMEMNVRLNHLKNIRGIGVFTALPGMGKSYALRCFAKSLNPNQYHMEYMCLSTISVADFYKQFCSILGVSDKGGKPAMFKTIQEQITYLCTATSTSPCSLPSMKPSTSAMASLMTSRCS